MWFVFLASYSIYFWEWKKIISFPFTILQKIWCKFYLFFWCQTEVNDLAALDDEQEGFLLLDALALLGQPVAWSALARVAALRRRWQQTQLRAWSVGARILRERLQRGVVHVHRQRLRYQVRDHRLVGALVLVRRRDAVQLPVRPV